MHLPRGNELFLSWVSLEKIPVKRTAASTAVPRTAPISAWGRKMGHLGVRWGKIRLIT